MLRFVSLASYVVSNLYNSFPPALSCMYRYRRCFCHDKVWSSRFSC